MYAVLAKCSAVVFENNANVHIVHLLNRPGCFKSRAWLQLDATWLQLDATWLQLDATWLQLDATWLQLDATWLQLDATWLQLDATPEATQPQFSWFRRLSIKIYCPVRLRPVFCVDI